MLRILSEVIVLVIMFLVIRSQKGKFFLNVLIYSGASTFFDCLLNGFSIRRIIGDIIGYFIFGLLFIFIMSAVENYDSPYIFVIVGIIVEIIIGVLLGLVFGALGIA